MLWMPSLALTTHLFRQWETATGKEVKVFQGAKGGLNTLTITKNGQYIIAGGDEKMVIIWDTEGNIISNYKGHSVSIKSIAISSDTESKYIVSADNSGVVKIWLTTEFYLNQRIAQLSDAQLTQTGAKFDHTHAFNEPTVTEKTVPLNNDNKNLDKKNLDKTPDNKPKSKSKKKKN
jgi:WD40 repeat protein